MIEFLRKFENRGIKIVRVNLILITKSIKTLILYGVGVRCCQGSLRALAFRYAIIRYISCRLAFTWEYWR